MNTLIYLVINAHQQVERAYKIEQNAENDKNNLNNGLAHYDRLYVRSLEISDLSQWLEDLKDE